MADRAERAPALHVDGDTLHLSGELGLGTVTAVLEPGRRALDAMRGDRVVLDLSGVTRSDSAGLALVLDWLRAARRRGLALDVQSIPQQMNDIARVSGLADLLSGDSVHVA